MLIFFMMTQFIQASKIDRDLISACAEGKDNVDEIRSLIDKGADVNARTEEGESVLHLACIWGGADRIRMLLNAGANPNFRASKVASSLDMTPLSWCVYAGYDDAVREFLRDERTNVNLLVRKENGECMTPLDITFILGDFGKTTRELLENAGALRSYEIEDDDLMPPSGCSE